MDGDARRARSPPVLYEFHFAPAFGGEDGSIHPQGTFVRYELRAVSSAADRAEVAMRNVQRALFTEDDQVVEAAVQRLLAIYPSSSHAYQIRGEVARRAGRQADAAEAFRRAVALLESGADALFVKHSGPRVRDTLNVLRLQLQRVQ